MLLVPLPTSRRRGAWPLPPRHDDPPTGRVQPAAEVVILEVEEEALIEPAELVPGRAPDRAQASGTASTSSTPSPDDAG